MEPTTILNIILSLTVLLFLILVTVRLFKKMKETKLANLKWLIVFFLSQSLIGFTKMAGFDLGFYLIEAIAFLSLELFTKETFYKDQQSAFKPIFVLSVILSIAALTLNTIASVATNAGLPDHYDSYHLMDLYMLSLLGIMSSLWYASASFAAYNQTKEEDIDVNIKKRYKVLGITALFLALQGACLTLFGNIAVPLTAEYNQGFFTIINVSYSLVFAFGNFYSWILLGKKIEKSREIASSEDEISEEEMMKMIKEGTK